MLQYIFLFLITTWATNNATSPNTTTCICDEIQQGSAIGQELCQYKVGGEEKCAFGVDCSDGIACILAGSYSEEVLVEGTFPEHVESWLSNCTQSLAALELMVACTQIAESDDVLVLTVSGFDEDVHSAVDELLSNGLTVNEQLYAVVEEDEETDGTLSLIVTASIFIFMCVLILGFFWCAEYPNKPEKIEARRLARLQQEDAEKKELPFYHTQGFSDVVKRPDF